MVDAATKLVQARIANATLCAVADLVNHMLSSRDFAEINFPEILGPDLFPMSASISLRQKGSRSVRDAATQTDSSFATSAPPQPACACNADNARLSILVPPCKVPTPQHSPSPLTAANAAPSLIYVTVDASLAAHLAPALPTLRAAGISSTIDIANVLLLEDGISDSSAPSWASRRNWTRRSLSRRSSGFRTLGARSDGGSSRSGCTSLGSPHCCVSSWFSGPCRSL